MNREICSEIAIPHVKNGHELQHNGTCFGNSCCCPAAAGRVPANQNFAPFASPSYLEILARAELTRTEFTSKRISMKRRIRVRFLVIACVTALSLGLFATRGINLGLDLKGGVQLGLQVVTDDAVRGVTDRAIQSLEANAQAVRNGVDQFTVTNTDSAVLSERLRDWDASPATTDGIPTYRLHLKPSIELQIRNDAVVDTMHVIQNRLDKLGVGEMTIQRSGKLDAYQILVQLPGARDPEQVKRLIQTTAVLEFKLVDFGPFPSMETATQNYGGVLPAHLELVPD